MSLFRRRKEADPVAERLAALREATVAAGSRPVTGLLEELGVPFQRKGEAWLVEVGGAWATLGWVPRDATLAGFLGAEPPRPSTELVRANADPGARLVPGRRPPTCWRA